MRILEWCALLVLVLLIVFSRDEPRKSGDGYQPVRGTGNPDPPKSYGGRDNHDNSEADECIHVEAARAQIRAANALAEIAETVGMAYDRAPGLIRRSFGGDGDA